MSTSNIYHLFALPYFEEQIIDHGELPVHYSSVDITKCLTKIVAVENQLIDKANEKLLADNQLTLSCAFINDIYLVEIQQLIERWSMYSTDPQFNLYVDFLKQKFNEKKLVAIFGITGDESDTYLVVQQ